MITDSDSLVNFKPVNFSKSTKPLAALFYKSCILCDAVSTRDFCDTCFDYLPDIPKNHCSICLKSLTSEAFPIHAAQRCGSCLAKPPAFDATIAALTYKFPIDALIHALKYQAQLAIAPVLAKLLFAKLKLINTTDKPDCIIPMPLHPNRLRERGFNQAMEITRHVAKAMKIEIIPDGCKRIRNTPPQIELPWKLRQKNVHNAFLCNYDFSGKHVAIIDDVMTTGATLNALALQLRKSGATQISNWIVARVQIDLFHSESDFDH